MGECCAEPPHSPFARGSSSNLPLHCGHRGHDVHRDGMVNLDRAHCVIQYVPSEHTASPCPPPLPRTSSHPPSARATLAPPQHASTRTWTCTHAHTRAHTRTHTLSTPRCSSRVCVHTHTHTRENAGLSATAASFSAAWCALFSTGPSGKRNHKPTNSQHTQQNSRHQNTQCQNHISSIVAAAAAAVATQHVTHVHYSL